MSDKTPEQLAKELNEKFDGFSQKAADALEEARKNGNLAAETKSAVDGLSTEVGTLREQLAAVEQKMQNRDSGETVVKSYGEQFAESDKFKSFRARGYSGSARIELKEITSAQANIVAARDNEVVGLPQRLMTIRQLLNVVPTNSGSVDYARQSLRTNNAAPVAESATKPYSDFAWAQETATVRTIAHLAKITRQAMDDDAQLRGEVEGEMRYGLRFTEEAQILNGDGTGQNLDGLIANATAYAAPFDPAGTETIVDMVRLAMLQVELALYPVDGIVLNSSDFARAELLKDADGNYLIGRPQGTIAPVLWGRPVVATPAMTIDKFLVGGFKLQTLYDRMAPEVLISSENATDFEENLYTMRCEERVAVAVKRPAALVYGDFGNVA